MRSILWIFVFGTILGGAAVVLSSLPDAYWGGLDPSPLGSGVAILAVGLTSGVALVTSSTWRDQRRKEVDAMLREQRARVYEDVLVGVIDSFKGKLAPVGPERAKVALWASQATISAFEIWFTFTAAIMNDKDGNLSSSDKLTAYNLVYRCVQGMRADLGISDDSQPGNAASSLQMIFFEYRSDVAAKGLLS